MGDGGWGDRLQVFHQRIAHTLLPHPKLDASLEGFVIKQVLAVEPHDEAWFWATHQGAGIDLLLRRGGRLPGVEVKRVDAPRLQPGRQTPPPVRARPRRGGAPAAGWPAPPPPWKATL